MNTSSDYVESLIEKLALAGYVADKEITVPLFLSLKLEKPLLLEGDPGCGKTELAKSLSSVFGTELIRLQCYEGLDASSSIYEWNYQKQLIAIRLAEKIKSTSKQVEKQIFSQEFLLPRPLLSTIMACNHATKKKDRNELAPPAILLIDEIDRADEEFEGLLLEFLGNSR